MDEHYKKHLFKTSEAPFFHASVSNFRAFSVVGENTKKRLFLGKKPYWNASHILNVPIVGSYFN